MNTNFEKPDLSALREVLPPFVARTHPRLKELTGFTGRSFANMDSLGRTRGIKRIMLGNAVAYERESLIKWLEQRSRVLPEVDKHAINTSAASAKGGYIS